MFHTLFHTPLLYEAVATDIVYYIKRNNAWSYTTHNNQLSDNQLTISEIFKVSTDILVYKAVVRASVAVLNRLNSERIVEFIEQIPKECPEFNPKLIEDIKSELMLLRL
jgi:hypothetical protein